jgi:hypothetical protein
MFRPHRAIFRQHTSMEPTTLCWLMPVVLVGVRCHCSQFENFCSFLSSYCSVSVALDICAAPLVVCSLYKEQNSRQHDLAFSFHINHFLDLKTGLFCSEFVILFMGCHDPVPSCHCFFPKRSHFLTVTETFKHASFLD